MFRKSLSENAEKQSVGLAGGQLTGRGDCPHWTKVIENSGKFVVLMLFLGMVSFLPPIE